MHLVFLVSTLILFLDTMVFVNAALFVFSPNQKSGCHGGESCTVEWVEDGLRPLLSTFGLSTVGLYTGKQQLVQAIEPVDVGQAHSLTFVPKPGAGPNSSNYYIGFTSTTFTVDGTVPETAFSSFFTLDGMTGSFNSPLSAATSTFSLPLVVSSSLSLSLSPSATVASHTPTITSTAPTSLHSPIPSESTTSPTLSASRLITSLSSQSSQVSTMPSSTPSSSPTPVSNNSLARIGQYHRPSFILAFICFVLLRFL